MYIRNKQIQQKKPASSPADKVQLLCVFYITIWAISPPLSYGVVYRLVAIIATALWLGIELLKRPSTFFRPSSATFFALFFIIYSAIVGLVVDGSEDFVRNMQIYIFLLFLIFYESYRKRDFRQLRIIFWASLILFPIWFGTTLLMYKEMPHISRDLVRSSELAEEYSKLGVGGYGLVYSAVIAIPVLLSMIKSRSASHLTKENDLIRKLLVGIVLLNLLLGCALIIKAGYSIAVILMLSGIILTLTIGRKFSSQLIRLSAIILVVLLISAFTAPILTGVAEKFSENPMYARKMQDIMGSLESKGSVGTVSERTDRYERSIDLFLANPVLGTLAFTDIGKHSAILDRFARYGIFVGAMFAYIVFYLPLRYLKKKSDRSYGMSLAVAFVVIGFSFLNNVFASFGYMVFIFYPVAMTYIEERESSSPSQRE